MRCSTWRFEPHSHHLPLNVPTFFAFALTLSASTLTGAHRIPKISSGRCPLHNSWRPFLRTACPTAAREKVRRRRRHFPPPPPSPPAFGHRRRRLPLPPLSPPAAVASRRCRLPPPPPSPPAAAAVASAVAAAAASSAARTLLAPLLPGSQGGAHMHTTASAAATAPAGTVSFGALGTRDSAFSFSYGCSRSLLAV